MWLEKTGCHSGVTRGNGGVHTIGKHIKGGLYLKENHLTSFLYLCSHLLVYSQKNRLRTSITVTLEYMVSKHVKLFDRLLDPNKPLVNQISYSPASSRPGDNCFICVWVHSFPICVPSFCKKGKTLKTQHQLLWKLRQKWNFYEDYTNRTTCTHMHKKCTYSGPANRDKIYGHSKHASWHICMPAVRNGNLENGGVHQGESQITLGAWENTQRDQDGSNTKKQWTLEFPSCNTAQGCL